MSGWAAVGVIVALVETRLRQDSDPTLVSVLCVVGAVAGGFVGQVTRLYVFGEPLGFVFSVAGAESLLWFYRTRSATTQATVTIPAVPAPAAAPANPFGVRLLEAYGWGVLGGAALAISGLKDCGRGLYSRP